MSSNRHAAIRGNAEAVFRNLVGFSTDNELHLPLTDLPWRGSDCPTARLSRSSKAGVFKKHMKIQIKGFSAVLAAGLLFTAGALASEGGVRGNLHIYDVTKDWSNTSNPNGVWSYNQNTNPITQFQTFWWGQPGWGYIWIGEGCVFKANPYPTGMMDPWGSPLTPPHDWKTGAITMHALSPPYGGDTTFVNVTWTSPGDGTIDISGRAWDAQIFADRDMSWSLTVGGNTVAQRSSIRGIFHKDKAARFNANRVGKHPLTRIPVTQGETVEFRLVATTYYGHFVGLDEHIIFHQKPQ
jgi:hypothetical protein